MRRILIALLAALLAVFPALAEDAPADVSRDDGSPVFSADVQLIYRANAALCSQYGLTAHCLGLFETDVIHCGDTALVHYASRGLPHPALTGEYMALVTPEDTQVFWTHDGVDPAVWQSGELNSTAWGAPQLTIFLQTDSFEREFLDDPYEPDEFAQWLDAEERFHGSRVTSLRAGTLAADDVWQPDAVAREALHLMYGLSDQAAAEMHLIDATRITYADGSCEWLLDFYHRTEPDEINYAVTIGTDGHTILEISCSTGGLG